MGCDIHAYVEHSKDGEYWKSFTDNLGSRNYRMFGIMAGVRCEDLQLFPAKGLPSGRFGHAANSAYWRSVAPESHPEWADTESWVSRETAEKWVDREYSVAEYEDGCIKRVSDPDSHSHSWLNAEELSQCVDRYRAISDGTAPTEWVATVAAMKAIEGNGDIARMIFWFDN